MSPMRVIQLLFALGLGCARVAGEWDLPSASACAGDRYVTYPFKRRGGANNRIQALTVSLAIAILTNRTLIAQPFSTIHIEGTATIVPYTEYLSPIDWPTILSDEVDTTLLSTERLPRFSSRRGLVEVAAQYQDSTADVLEFQGTCAYWESMFGEREVAFIRAVREKYVNYKNGLVDAANLLIAQLPTGYNALHFRLGDRPGLALLDCEAVGLRHGSSADVKGLSASWHHQDVGQTFRQGCVAQRENGSWVVGTMELAVAKSGILQEGGVMYMATNKADDPRVSALATKIERGSGGRRGEARTWEDFHPAVVAEALALASSMAGAPREGSLISALEQLICANASRFFPSWPSSWDTFVIGMRLAQDRSDAQKHFELTVEHGQWARGGFKHSPALIAMSSIDDTVTVTVTPPWPLVAGGIALVAFCALRAQHTSYWRGLVESHHSSDALQSDVEQELL